MSLSSCCLTGFTWKGEPTGRVGTLGSNPSYITGTNPHAAILIVHDAFGWTFPNVRLLADHLAHEAHATVFVPDFFAGEHLPWEILNADNFAALAPLIPAFIELNSRALREPEIFACARALKHELGFKTVGAAGFCYGGRACFRLAAAEHNPPLVDCITVGHPSLLIKEDLDGVGNGGVPVQMLAPEIDHAYTPELKLHSFLKLQELGVPFEYRNFPGAVHGCFIRGKEDKPGEREAMVQGKNAIVGWLREWLHGVTKQGESS